MPQNRLFAALLCVLFVGACDFVGEGVGGRGRFSGAGLLSDRQRGRDEGTASENAAAGEGIRNCVCHGVRPWLWVQHRTTREHRHPNTL